MAAGESVDTVLTLKGQIERDVAALFIEQLAGMDREDAPLVLDMGDADIEDSRVATMLVEYIRQTAQRVGHVQILRAPQILAHSLYRVGALGSQSTIELIEPRVELGASS
jgi:anti-anti-sigma regulatory factor